MGVTKISQSIDSFSSEMKTRMLDKEPYFVGWERAFRFDCAERMLVKAANVVALGKDVDRKHLIDIANFAMMLAHHQQALQGDKQ